VVSLGEPDATTRRAHQRRAELSFEPTDVMGDRRLGVAQDPGGRGGGTVVRDRTTHQQPPEVKHRTSTAKRFLDA